jgi:hypothetical protein
MVPTSSRCFPLLEQLPYLQTFWFSVFTICSSGGGLVAYADAQQDQPQGPKKKKVVVLGTGWAGTTFVRNLDSKLYDVQVISPRNYFAFTPLLPSVTCGTVEPRSVVEPIRRILEKVRLLPEISGHLLSSSRILLLSQLLNTHSKIQILKRLRFRL